MVIISLILLKNTFGKTFILLMSVKKFLKDKTNLIMFLCFKFYFILLLISFLLSQKQMCFLFFFFLNMHVWVVEYPPPPPPPHTHTLTLDVLCEWYLMQRHLHCL